MASSTIRRPKTRPKCSTTRSAATSTPGEWPSTRWTDVTRSAPQTREIEFFTVEGRYRQTLAKTLTIEGAVLYRTEQDTFSGDDEGVDVDLSLEWLYRQTEIRVTYEYGRFEDDFAENRTSSLYVQIRRRF